MGLVGTVVDDSMAGAKHPRELLHWTDGSVSREVGLAEDVEKLKFEMRNMEMVIAAADGRRIDNKPLARSLDDLKDLLYEPEDVMDELDYY